jgi:hypothetical protein
MVEMEDAAVLGVEVDALLLAMRRRCCRASRARRAVVTVFSS